MNRFSQICVYASLLAIVIAGSVTASGLQSGAFQLNSEPIREAFSLSLAMDEWDSPETEKETGRVESDQSGKSRWKAIALSALIPGGGEYYLGYKKRARMFFVAEALTIVGYASFKLHASWKEDDMARYASTYAGASLEGKSNLYVDMLGFYRDNNHYNTEGRVGDQHRPYFPDDETYHWRWQSDEQMSAFRELNSALGRSDQRAKFMLGLAVVSRIVSIIDVAISSRNLGGVGGDEFASAPPDSFKFKINPLSSRRQLVLSWQTSLF